MSWGFLLAVYLSAFGGLAVLALHDREKARIAIKTAARSFVGVLPALLVVAGVIGLLLGLVPTEMIGRVLGRQSGWWAPVAAALIGAVSHIPSFVAFPLARSVLQAGADIATVAAFVTSLVMVGAVTLPMEIKHLGVRMAMGRNLLSLIAALAIAVVIGTVLR